MVLILSEVPHSLGSRHQVNGNAQNQLSVLLELTNVPAEEDRKLVKKKK